MSARIVGPGGSVRIVDAEGHAADVTSDGKLRVAAALDVAQPLTLGELESLLPLAVAAPPRGMVSEPFDRVALAYDPQSLLWTGATFYNGGSVVAVIEAGYVGGLLTSVQRTA